MKGVSRTPRRGNHRTASAQQAQGRASRGWRRLEAAGLSGKTKLRECLMLADILRDHGGRGHGVELVMIPYQTKQTEK